MPETLVWIGGHLLDCEYRESGGMIACDCDEMYEQTFNRCSECGADLDKFGECTEYEEHLYA